MTHFLFVYIQEVLQEKLLNPKTQMGSTSVIKSKTIFFFQDHLPNKNSSISGLNLWCDSGTAALSHKNDYRYMGYG